MNSLEYHQKLRGKIEVISRAHIESREDLSLAYTPGVAEPCQDIAQNPEKVYEYTRKGNLVAVVTDGSAVLGLGNIGPAASLPVMEGKCVLFKEFADVDAFPIAIKTQDVDEFVRTVELISPMFGGINLEDIAAPRCFEIEEKLKERLDIPVFHDDQHGTAIVVLAGLYNALKLAHKKIAEVRIVINGSGAAGTAITKLIHAAGGRNFILLDSKGILNSGRSDLNDEKKDLIRDVGALDVEGGLVEAMRDADVFIGVSRGGIVNKDMVASMAPQSIVFAMANPTPEIFPSDAKEAGAFIVGSGRSDFPNQVNNVLVFPGFFRGLLDGRIKQVAEDMKLRAAQALADYVTEPHPEKIIPDALDKNVAAVVAAAVRFS